MTSVLGKDANGISITIDKAQRREGLYIQGSTGTGKSTMLLNLILDDITDGTGVCLLDPHRDLTNRVIECMEPSRYEDVILLDITGDNPFGLNLYECADPTDYKQVQYTIERIMHIWDRLFNISRLTPQMVEYMRNCAYTIVSNPGYTMAEIPFLFSDKKFRTKLLANVKNVYVKQFWQDYENMPNLDRSRETSAIRNKLSEFLQDFTVPIVGQTKSTINMREIMDATPGKILLCKLDPNLDSVTSLIGSTIIALIRNAAFSREDIPIRRRKPFNIYLEEGDRFATLDTKSLMDEGRKYGTTVTFTLQTRDKLHREVPQLVRSTLQGNVVAFRLTAPDSEEVAGVFDTTPRASTETRRESVLVPKRDVITHLIKQGHENEDVMNFVAKYLQKIVSASEERDIDESTVYVKMSISRDKYPYFYLPQEVKRSVSELNDLLYLHNSGEWRGMDKKYILAEHDRVMKKLRKAFAPVLEYPYYYQAWYEPEKPAIIEAHRQLSIVKKAQEEWLIKYRGTKLSEETKKIYIDLDNEEKKWSAIINQESIDSIYAYLNYPYNQHLVDELQEQSKRDHKYQSSMCGSFELYLILACLGIAQKPIWADSGRYEYKPVTQQTHVDKQAEIANMLTQLPNMTAYVRVAGQEHTITVKHAQPDGRRSPLGNVIRTITEWNLEDGYIRDRAEVEKEIEARHHDDDDPPPPPGGSGGGAAPKQPDNGSTPSVNRPPTPLPTPRKRKFDS